MISIVIRTYNEEKYISALIQRIHEQITTYPVEIIIVDSGSTDQTVSMVKRCIDLICHPEPFVPQGKLREGSLFDIRFYSIPQKKFTYGYALNYGLSRAKGDIAVSISAHCLPIDKNWLNQLILPLQDPIVAVTYGRQMAAPTSRLSEVRIFAEMFPSSSNKYDGIAFCHNANCAFKIAAWKECPFDEKLKALEDLAFAIKLNQVNFKSQYVPDAIVYHYHEETNTRVFNRYNREALALKEITADRSQDVLSLIMEFIKALIGDYWLAMKRGKFVSHFFDILGYRLAQYGGRFRVDLDN